MLGLHSCPTFRDSAQYNVASGITMSVKENFLGLPFTGRDDELEQINSFFHNAINGDETAVMWISGEAGMGKSRLLEQARIRFPTSQTIIVFARFYPDSTTSVTRALTAALSSIHAVRKLYPQEIEPTQDSLLSALQHLLQIRPTILILEDLHLLSEADAFELKSIIDTISLDPICVLATSRAGRNPTYISLLPYIKQTLHLQPFSVTNTRLLLEHYGLMGYEELAHQIHQASYGSPLILTSIIPELTRYLHSLGHNNGNIGQQLRSKINSLIMALSWELLWQLTPEQAAWARSLSFLGEVFSPEAAETVLPNATECLSVLKEQGVIVDAVHFIEPLWGKTAADTPLQFAHTFVHHQLLHQVELTQVSILPLLCSEAAMYSTTSLTLTAEHNWDMIAPEVTSKVFLWLAETIETIDAVSPNLALAHAHIMFEYFEKYAPTWTEEQQHAHKVRLLHQKIWWYDSLGEIENHAQCIAELKSITEEPQDRNAAIQRLAVLGTAFNIHQPWKPQIEQTIAECAALLSRYPSITNSQEFIYLLYNISSTFIREPEKEFVQWVETHFTVLRTLLSEDDPFYQQAIVQVGSNLLLEFNTPEELVEKQELSKKIARSVTRTVYWEAFWPLLELQLESGNSRKAWQLIQQHLQGQIYVDSKRRTLLQARQIRLLIEWGFSVEEVQRFVLNKIKEATLSSGTSAPAFNSEQFRRRMFAWVLTRAGIMTPQFNTFLNMAKEVFKETPEPDLSIAILRKDSALLREALTAPFPALFSSLLPLVQAVVQSTKLDRTSIANIIEHLHTPPVHHNHLRLTRMIFPLLDMLYPDSNRPLPKDLSSALQRALHHCLEWSANNRLSGLINMFLEVAPHHLSNKEYEQWQEVRENIYHEIRAVYGGRRKGQEEVNDAKIHLSLFGSIAIKLSGQYPQKVTGARLKQMLGMLVANQVMSRPLSVQEFRSIATENPNDTANAGNYVRIIVSRLRKLLGNDAILTNRAAPPRLNLDIVDVDILKAREHLNNCAKAVQLLHIRKAKQELFLALDIAQKGPAYPTLYGNFFESARLDFEAQMKERVLQVVHVLNISNDYESAVDVLQAAFNIVHYDEEVLAEYLRVLQTTGRNSEALVIKRHWERMVES